MGMSRFKSALGYHRDLTSGKVHLMANYLQSKVNFTVYIATTDLHVYTLRK